MGEKDDLWEQFKKDSKILNQARAENSQCFLSQPETNEDKKRIEAFFQSLKQMR